MCCSRFWLHCNWTSEYIVCVSDLKWLVSYEYKYRFKSWYFKCLYYMRPACVCVCSWLMNGTWMNSILKWKIDLWYLLFMHDIQLHSIGVSLLLHLIVLSVNIYKLLSSLNFRRIRKSPIGIAVSLALSPSLCCSLPLYLWPTIVWYFDFHGVWSDLLPKYSYKYLLNSIIRHLNRYGMYLTVPISFNESSVCTRNGRVTALLFITTETMYDAVSIEKICRGERTIRHSSVFQVLKLHMHSSDGEKAYWLIKLPESY